MPIRPVVLIAILALSAGSTDGLCFEPSISSRAPSRANAGPPTVNGVYIYPDCEGEGGCPSGYWRAMAPTKMLATGSPAARVIAVLTPGEWVSVQTIETRIVPVRGVARKRFNGVRAGAVVYRLEYEGEGFSTYWIASKSQSWEEELPIDWDRSVISPTMKAKLGLWVKVKRDNGQIGWVHNATFECMSKLAGDEGCRD